MRKAKATQEIKVAPPVFGDDMEDTEDLAGWLAEEDIIADRNFASGLTTGINRPYLTIKNSIINRQVFIDCSFKSAQISDVKFVNCDLSNLSLSGSSLYRVEFISCKLVGANLSETTMNHVLMDDCNGNYINLSISKLNQVKLSRCDFRNGSISELRPGLFEFDNCRLTEADLSRTALRGMDLRNSQIEGIQINIPDLRGAIVSSTQAMDLIPLLGVVVKD